MIFVSLSHCAHAMVLLGHHSFVALYFRFPLCTVICLISMEYIYPKALPHIGAATTPTAQHDTPEASNPAPRTDHLANGLG